MHDWLKKYLHAIAFSLCVFIFFSLYLYFRRGYYTLYIANKVLAGVAGIDLATTLFLGELGRLYDVFDPYVIYRKQLGVVAFFFGLVHGIVSFLFLQDIFPAVTYTSLNIYYLYGMACLIVLFYLFVLSIEKVKLHLDTVKWWYFHNWGARLAGILLILHVFPLKYLNYVVWYRDGGQTYLSHPFMPPAGLVAISWVVFVFFARLAECWGADRARWLIKGLLYIYIVFLIGSFGWGVYRNPWRGPMTWEDCATLPHAHVDLRGEQQVCWTDDGRKVVSVP